MNTDISLDYVLYHLQWYHQQWSLPSVKAVPYLMFNLYGSNKIMFFFYFCCLFNISIISDYMVSGGITDK